MKIEYIVYESKYQKNVEELNELSSQGQLAKYNQTDKNPILEIQDKYFSNGGCFWIAIDKDNQNKVVGMVGVRKVDGSMAKVKALRVLPEYRRHKIGENLMIILEKYCKNNSLTEITLGVGDDVDSIPAIKLYESLGYEKTERVEKQPGIWAINYHKFIN